MDPRPGSLQAKQQTRREHHPTHQQTIRLKLHWAQPCPPEQDPVFPPSPSHQEAYTSLLAAPIREQTEARRTTIPQWSEQKPHYRKLIRIKKHKIMSHMKGQDKTPEKRKQLNEVKIGKIPEKEFRIMIVKTNPGSRENNAEDARNVYQRPRQTKEQTNWNE